MKAEETSDSDMLLEDFIKHFNIHYSLLLRRYKRFKEIDNIKNTDIDIITYLDMIVVQIRAMCIESPYLKNNYTAQILLRKLGEDSLADKIDKMLDEPFIPTTNITIRTAIKKLADGFICHYDNFDGLKSDEWYYSETIEKRLRSPYEHANLDYIMGTLIDCIGEGFRIRLN